MALTVLFLADPLDPDKIDPAFEREVKAARQVGCFVGSVTEDLDVLNVDLEANHVGEPVVYRGWMITPSKYQQLYEALWDRGFQLINSPAEYRYCHELPQWYGDFEGATPKSVWGGEAIGLEAHEWDYAYVHTALGDGPLIVKDYVKSRKHEWAEACYIPGPDDLDRVTKRFIELQGEDLAGGVVHRQFIPFKQVGKHPKSGMPIYNEIRLWVLSGSPLTGHAYWGPDEGGADITLPCSPWGHAWESVSLCRFSDEVPRFQRLSEVRAKSNFYTVDVAQHEHGLWTVIELGDGQVSGLPHHVDVEEFYRGLKRRFTF